MYKVIGSRKIKNRQQAVRKNPVAHSFWLYRLAALLFLVTLIYVLFFSPQLEITFIRISGLNRVSEGSVRSVVDNKLSEKYLGFIAKNNLLIFRPSMLGKDLVGQFKYIQDVQINKVFPHTIEIIVKERKLSMLFCGTSACYTLDENGISYPAANFTQEELAKEDLITLNDSGGSQFDGEERPLEVDFRTFVLGIGSSVQDETGLVLKKTYETTNRMSGDLKVETNDGLQIYFNESVGLEKSAATLRAVLENKIAKEQQKDLEYIDLRVDNKVFYKFKDGSGVQNAPTDATTNITPALPEPKKKKN